MKNTGTALITEYLGSGGLFNPEMMEHDKVRDMLIGLRDDMISLENHLHIATGALRRVMLHSSTSAPDVRNRDYCFQVSEEALKGIEG